MLCKEWTGVQFTTKCRETRVFGGNLVPSHVVSMNKSGEDFFGKIDFGHFFCPIFKTQNTLCQKIF